MTFNLKSRVGCCILQSVPFFVNNSKIVRLGDTFFTVLLPIVMPFLVFFQTSTSLRMMYYFLKLILYSGALDEEAADVHKGHNKYEMSEGSP